jgi:hypothetical protein
MCTCGDTARRVQEAPFLEGALVPGNHKNLCCGIRVALKPWAWRKTAWEVALCAEGSGFDSCPPHGAFLWGNDIVIFRLAEWPVPLWGLSEG